MRTFTALALPILLFTFVGCSTTHPARGAKAGPETVMVTYHVQTGKETTFQGLLAHAWEIYRGKHMVFVQPHIVIRDIEGDGATCIGQFLVVDIMPKPATGL